MKRLIPLTLFGLLLAACQTHQVKAGSSQQSLEQQLMHHNFVLTEVDGQRIAKKQTAPSISFGEKLFVSASMCNDFNGMGTINNATLKVKTLSKTELECVDEDLSRWDSLINRMLKNGATVTLTKDHLTLTQGHYKLVYALSDYMQ